jgi:hypothetical protein
LAEKVIFPTVSEVTVIVDAILKVVWDAIEIETIGSLRSVNVTYP